MLRHCRIPLLLTLAIFLAEVIIRVLAQAVNTGHDFDLFTPLAALMPGQGVNGLEAYSPGCWHVDIGLPPVSSLPVKCSMQLYEPSFTRADVIVQNEVIHTLIVEVDRLCIGDLGEQWGKPDRIANLSGEWVVSWGKTKRASAPGKGRFSYWLPIRIITFSLGDQRSPP